jgi:hypothetical protein
MIPCAKNPSYPRKPRTDVRALNRGLGRSEAQTDVLVPSSAALASSRRLGLRLGVEEDVRLLLESALRLHGKFGGHGCGCGWLSRSQVVVVGLGFGGKNEILGLRFFGGLA